MKRSLVVLALAFSGAALAQLPGKEPAKPAAPAAPATGPVATVNGVAIPRARMDTALKMQKERGVPDNDQVRSQIRDLLVNNELLNQEASRSGLLKKADVQQQLELVRAETIANLLVQDYLKAHPVTSDDIQKEYNRVKAEQGNREYKARHILVATEDEAKGILAELKKGAKFEEIAQKRSLDEGTKPRGGELDWTAPGSLEKSFADAMVKLSKGQTTEAPVRTRYGFHIVRVDDVRDLKFPDLGQVRSQIEQQLAQQRVVALLRDLRAKAKIE